MLELGEKLVNKSDMRMRPLGKNDFFEFRRAATESTETGDEGKGRWDKEDKDGEGGEGGGRHSQLSNA